MAEMLRAPARLDLAAVGPLHADLLAHAGGDVTVDMADVTQIGALCAQTIIAGARAISGAGCQMRLINVSDRVLAQLAAMGLTPETMTEGP